MKDDFTKGAGGELYATIGEKDFDTVMHFLEKDGFELISLYCAEDFGTHPGFTLFYAMEKRGLTDAVVFMLPLRRDTNISIAKIFPTACWYEREAADMFGIRFIGSFDERRLMLHETYPKGSHPLRKSFVNTTIPTEDAIAPEDEYAFKKMDGEGVYEIPVGPVHAGIIEPGHFRFSAIGETVYNLEVRMFYKHRGIEKLAEGKKPEDCVKIAESISGDETVANAVAYCKAVEDISGTSAPERAWRLRTVFLELERIYSLLGDLAGMAVDVAYPVGASSFFMLREEVLRWNEASTGSRFMKGMIEVGGLKKDVDKEALTALDIFLTGFRKKFSSAAEEIRSSSSTIDRFERTGIVPKELIAPLHVTGPVARAAGSASDTRIDHPYGIYGRFKPNVKVHEAGDVLARFEVKCAEIEESTRIIAEVLEDIADGSVCAEVGIKDGFTLSLIESARGQSFHFVNIKNGRIDRYKVKTASYCNWQILEHAALGNIVPDFPLINKSLNLSYAGTDL